MNIILPTYLINKFNFIFCKITQAYWNIPYKITSIDCDKQILNSYLYYMKQLEEVTFKSYSRKILSIIRIIKKFKIMIILVIIFTFFFKIRLRYYSIAVQIRNNYDNSI